MPAPKLEDLRADYEQLFSTAEIRADRVNEVDRTVDAIVRNKNVYEGIMDAVGMPWQVVGVIHCMESDLDFRTHLHNGDPLTARTVQVPAGRPKSGSPPFTFQESAIDALQMKGLDKISDWDVAMTLYQLERYNGFGYRPKKINSPYLWNFSNQYSKGKFVRDGVFDRDAVSKQCGSAVILKRMVEREVFAFAGLPRPVNVRINGAEVDVLAFVQKGNSWIQPRMLEPLIPGVKIAGLREDPFRITVQFKESVRTFDARRFKLRGYVDASDLIRDFMGLELDLVSTTTPAHLAITA